MKHPQKQRLHLHICAVIYCPPPAGSARSCTSIASNRGALILCGRRERIIGITCEFRFTAHVSQVRNEM